MDPTCFACGADLIPGLNTVFCSLACEEANMTCDCEGDDCVPRHEGGTACGAKATHTVSDSDGHPTYFSCDECSDAYLDELAPPCDHKPGDAPCGYDCPQFDARNPSEA